jgi:hypothetical protein
MAWRRWRGYRIVAAVKGFDRNAAEGGKIPVRTIHA